MFRFTALNHLHIYHDTKLKVLHSRGGTITVQLEHLHWGLQVGLSTENH